MQKIARSTACPCGISALGNWLSPAAGTPAAVSQAHGVMSGCCVTRQDILLQPCAGVGTASQCPPAPSHVGQCRAGQGGEAPSPSPQKQVFSPSWVLRGAQAWGLFPVRCSPHILTLLIWVCWAGSPHGWQGCHRDVGHPGTLFLFATPWCWRAFCQKLDGGY